MPLLNPPEADKIGPRFEDSEKLTRRDLRSLRDKFASTLIGFVLALFWHCIGFELALFSGTAKMSFLS